MSSDPSDKNSLGARLNATPLALRAPLEEGRLLVFPPGSSISPDSPASGSASDSAWLFSAAGSGREPCTSATPVSASGSGGNSAVEPVLGNTGTDGVLVRPLPSPAISSRSSGVTAFRSRWRRLGICSMRCVRYFLFVTATLLFIGLFGAPLGSTGAKFGSEMGLPSRDSSIRNLTLNTLAMSV